MSGWPATKVCTGPAHPGPTRLPLDPEHWYFHRSGVSAGQPTARCKLCANWSKLVKKEGPHGLVPAKPVVRYLLELIDRCGSQDQVQELHGINRSAQARLLAHQGAKVQKRTAVRVLTALDQQRREDRRNGASSRFVAARRAQGQREERLIRLEGY